MRMASWICGRFQKYLICFKAWSKSRSYLKARPNSLEKTGSREMETSADITSHRKVLHSSWLPQTHLIQTWLW